MSKTTSVFFGGRPTGPQLNKLREAFPRVEREQAISHEEIAATIGEPIGTPRYWNIVDRWRRWHLGEHGIFIARRRKEGFQGATDDEQLRTGRVRLKTASSYTRSAGQLVSTVSVAMLPPASRPQHAQAVKAIETLYNSLRSERKTIDKLLASA